MIRKFDEKFKDLLVESNGTLRETLKTPDEEYNPYPEQRYDNMSLFILSQRPGGFVENYCLIRENKKRLDDIRKNIEKNPDLLMNVILVLDKYLPGGYKEFSKLSIFEQDILLKDTRMILNDEDLDLFEKVFNDLSTKYKTKELKLDETESK